MSVCVRVGPVACTHVHSLCLAPPQRTQGKWASCCIGRSLKTLKVIFSPYLRGNDSLGRGPVRITLTWNKKQPLTPGWFRRCTETNGKTVGSPWRTDNGGVYRGGRPLWLRAFDTAALGLACFPRTPEATQPKRQKCEATSARPAHISVISFSILSQHCSHTAYFRWINDSFVWE